MVTDTNLMEQILKIYFAGAIRGGRDDVALYTEMISFLNTLGEVLTEHVGDQELTEAGNDGPDDRYIHDRDILWLNQCDIVVAEVSVPSLGVGYELGQAVSLNKPVLCLYRSGSHKKLSAMIGGSPDMEVIEYSRIDEAKKHISTFINKVAEDTHKESHK